MIPPTPTSMPTGSEIINITGSYSLWGGVQTAVQAWNWLGGIGIALQIIILALIVWAGIVVLQKFIQEYTTKDAQS